MAIAGNIHYLQNHEIDRERWDACIDNAANGLIYAYSFYLDAMCDHWDAIIIDDYKLVMPLSWRQKWGIKYLYIQPFVQQLGLFGNASFNRYNELFELISRYFVYGDICFNYKNKLTAPFTSYEKTNFILPLDQPYEVIAASFSKDLIRNIKTANKIPYTISNTATARRAIDLFYHHYSTRLPYNVQQFSKLLNLSKQLQERNMLFIRSIETDQQETLAIGLFLNDNKRIYNILNTTTTNGRNKRVNHLLLAEVIKEFAGKNLLFDFEGSDITGVKQFYLQFNPQNQPYTLIHFNKLPFYLNMIQRLNKLYRERYRLKS
jgi:hypothetical protein